MSSHFVVGVVVGAAAFWAWGRFKPRPKAAA